MKPKGPPPGSAPLPPAAARARDTRTGADPPIDDRTDDSAEADENDADDVDTDDDVDASVDADVESDADTDARIVERPDGYHWVTPDGLREFGPFETVGAARADMRAGTDDAPEPAQTLQEAERDIGMADWIDPLTGEPAEGQSPPHLDEG